LKSSHAYRYSGHRYPLITPHNQPLGLKVCFASPLDAFPDSITIHRRRFLHLLHFIFLLQLTERFKGEKAKLCQAHAARGESSTQKAKTGEKPQAPGR